VTVTSPRWLQAVVFDFDGVLANTEPLHLRAFQDTLAARGVGLDQEAYSGRYLGFDDRTVFESIASDRGLDWSAAEIDRLVGAKAARFRALVEVQPVLFDGVAQRVREWAAQVPIAIASGALRGEIEFVLGAARLGSLFRVIVAAGETPLGKPAPDPYRAAIDRLRVDPRRAVAVEDSVWGIESARGAGMKVAAVATSCPRERLAGADAVVTAFGDLTLPRLEELARR
jgi:beta-phosphoglucomutase-like phosphatase (HAD superfamily)